MNRRDSLLALTALGAALPWRAKAQPARRAKPYRIGVIPNVSEARYGHIRSALDGLGWREGVDYVLVHSLGVQGIDAVQTVKQVVDAQPDLILSSTTSYTLTAHRLTRTIPIVMWTSGFPVEAGVADSLAHPGRNVTGLSIYAGTDIFGKLLEVLRDVRPELERVGVLWTYVPPFHPREEIEPCYRELRAGAERLSLGLRIEEIAAAARTREALAAMAAENVGAMLVTSAYPRIPYRQEAMDFALARRMPTVCDFDWTGTEPHPLLRYSPTPISLLRQAAGYIRRILEEGANPAELPIQQPSRLELEVHLKTAKAIGLEVPSSILLRADRVIE